MDKTSIPPEILLTDAKSRLEDILHAISWREIARTYFGRSSSWLYHKLDGIKSDGSPGGGFTLQITICRQGKLGTTSLPSFFKLKIENYDSILRPIPQSPN